MIAATVKAARGRVPVIAGAGGNATSEALALTKASEDAGADALLHVTPYYNRPEPGGPVPPLRGDREVRRSCRSSSTTCRRAPRAICSTETVVRLAEFDNIVAIKDATGNLVRGGELIAKVGERMTVLSGDDGTAFPLYALGARGVISVVSNVAPREMAEMWDAVKAGDWDAREASSTTSCAR